MIDTTGSYHQVKDGYYMYVFDKPVSASSAKEEHFEMISDYVIKPGECKREEDNCIPQLRANMLAMAGGLAHCAITQNFNKLRFMALDVIMIRGTPHTTG